MVTTTVLLKLREAGHTEKEIKEMSPYTLINAVLEWEGIIGYTTMIENLVLTAHDKA